MNVTFCGSDKCKHMMGFSCKISDNWPLEIILHEYKILFWYHMLQVHRPHITNFNFVMFKSTRIWTLNSHCGLSHSSHIHGIHVIYIWFFRINFTEITNSYVWLLPLMNDWLNSLLKFAMQSMLLILHVHSVQLWWCYNSSIF